MPLGCTTGSYSIPMVRLRSNDVGAHPTVGLCASLEKQFGSNRATLPTPFPSLTALGQKESGWENALPVTSTLLVLKQELSEHAASDGCQLVIGMT